MLAPVVFCAGGVRGKRLVVGASSVGVGVDAVGRIRAWLGAGLAPFTGEPLDYSLGVGWWW